MTAMASELDAKIPAVDAETARRLKRLVRDAMELAQAARTSSSFEQLAEEEAELRARLGASGKKFSAQDRLSRDEAHARDALH